VLVVVYVHASWSVSRHEMVAKALLSALPDDPNWSEVDDSSGKFAFLKCPGGVSSCLMKNVPGQLEQWLGRES
jgi:hypothetical protein